MPAILKLNTVKIATVINTTKNFGNVIERGLQGPKGDSGVVQSVVAGENISVDDADPANPIVSAATSDFLDHYQYQIPSAESSGVTRTFTGEAIGLKIEVFILNATLLQGVDFTVAIVGGNTIVTLAEDPFGTPAVYANYWIE